MYEQDRQITEAVAREGSRLRNFIRRWVPDEADAEDVLQEVFFELVEAQRLMTPLREAGAWMFRVARNRITDLFRRRGREARAPFERDLDGEALALEEWLPSRDAGPEAAFARRVLLEELDAALEELPEDQRRVFVAHELEGRTFKELAAATGVPVNTLLSRKRYAVLHLRKRLRAIYEEYVDVQA
ncbi:RNA polymerase sigma factor [Mesoterricola silvestris]|uniref:RNA polymerase subunit sigma-24 n=1 Tax=Mesoterricola silvestris TaxID=2927979 RepID=A0AA48K9X8_9BACT|nr:RNA polymerase sigma factor [Mesoterricola silvestris]BDU74001.1 RNA polymerase subunit sigma-24 [Mesoterricola silvestris]